MIKIIAEISIKDTSANPTVCSLGTDNNLIVPIQKSITEYSEMMLIKLKSGCNDDIPLIIMAGPAEYAIRENILGKFLLHLNLGNNSLIIRAER